MRWVTCQVRGDGPDRVGIFDDASLRLARAGVSLVELLGDLSRTGEELTRAPDEVVDADDVTLCPPIPHPPSVRDFYAFEEHVATARRARGEDVDPDWYELPVFYFSNPHAIVGPGETVAIPPGSHRMDYELEVAAVLGRGGRDLDVAEAEAAIAGYTIMNDWSARDVQAREMRQLLGPAKGKDFATSLGPWLVTPDEIADRRAGKAYDLTMTAAVNGVEYSRGNLVDLHWSFAEMVSYASRGAPVAPGDVIGSGTVGTGCILELSLVHGVDAYPWLRPGDEVTLTVDALGELTNHVGA